MCGKIRTIPLLRSLLINVNHGSDPRVEALPMNPKLHPVKAPSILVIDLEATCDEGDGLPAGEMEIIEIGAVWATADGEVLDSFEALIRPVVHRQLSAFCLQLTGIQQAEVDGADLFPHVAQQLADFAQKHPRGNNLGQLGKIRRQAVGPGLRAPRNAPSVAGPGACELEAPIRKGPQNQRSRYGAGPSNGQPSARWRAPPWPLRCKEHRQTAALVSIACGGTRGLCWTNRSIADGLDVWGNSRNQRPTLSGVQ